MTEPSSPTSQPYLNAWGTDPREVDPDYCPECEQINPRHYDNCSKEGRERAQAALAVPFQHEWHTARFTGTTSCTRCHLMPIEPGDEDMPCVPAWAEHLVRHA